MYLTYVDGSNGPTAHANYYMTVHRSWEWQADKRPNDGQWQQVQLTAENPGVVYNNGTFTCQWNSDNPLIADESEQNKQWVSGAFTIAGAATVYPGLNAFLTAVGYAVDKFAPGPFTGGAAFDDCWKDGSSTFSSYPAGYASMTDVQKSAVRAYYSMTPYFFVHYTIRYYIADTWDLRGYEGQKRKAWETLDTGADGKTPATGDWCGAFTKNTDTTSPAVPTHKGP